MVTVLFQEGDAWEGKGRTKANGNEIDLGLDTPRLAPNILPHGFVKTGQRHKMQCRLVVAQLSHTNHYFFGDVGPSS